jgi:hypothetical protein
LFARSQFRKRLMKYNKLKRLFNDQQAFQCFRQSSNIQNRNPIRGSLIVESLL